MKRTVMLVALLTVALALTGCELFGASKAEATKTANELVKARAATPVVITNTVQVTTTTLITTTASLAPANTPTATPTNAPSPALAKAEAVPCEQLPTSYAKPPQPQVGHPSFYIETGIPNTRCWVVTINDGFTAVVGGVNVNDKTGGVYTAILGPRTVTLTVENGFVAIPVNTVARDEFCFRLGQAVQYKWAHDNVYPLANWADCTFAGSTSATSTITTTVTVSTNVRTATGKGNKTLSFPAGAPVAGFLIALSDGRTCNGCYVEKAPLAGTVTDGVIWPWPEEVVGLAKPDWK